jgi:opacity protein-like surface antigen
MAVGDAKMPAWRALLLASGLAVGAGLATAPTHADSDARDATTVASPGKSAAGSPWTARAKARTRRGEPEWLRRLEEDRPASTAADDGDVCVTLQDDRPDGFDLLTARYTLHETGAFKTYAGAGLNRAQYFQDDPGDPGPTWFNKRNRRTSVGAAAELGAEVQVSARMRFNADLRWIDLDSRAEALRSDHGPVVADPLMLGVAVGYRFR